MGGVDRRGCRARGRRRGSRPRRPLTASVKEVMRRVHELGRVARKRQPGRLIRLGDRRRVGGDPLLQVVYPVAEVLLWAHQPVVVDVRRVAVPQQVEIRAVGRRQIRDRTRRRTTGAWAFNRPPVKTASPISAADVIQRVFIAASFGARADRVRTKTFPTGELYGRGRPFRNRYTSKIGNHTSVLSARSGWRGRGLESSEAPAHPGRPGRGFRRLQPGHTDRTLPTGS